MNAPNTCQRRILVAACGMTPQIVTETLYALRVAAAQPFHVNEVRIVTTLAGRDQAINSLLVGGRWRDLCEEYGFDDIRFDADCIEVIRDDRDAELADIQTPEDNRHAADSITDLVRRLTRDPESALHVSLAGGRKTMGYYIGYALSLFGRAQDRLSHVLVDEGFEGHSDFFFPTRESRMIKTRSGLYLDASRARVMLAEIPFVRLRDTLPPRLLAEKTTFSEAVRWSNLDQEPVRLEFDLKARTVCASGEPIKLSRKELALYAAFARTASEEEPEFEWTDRIQPLVRAFAEELARCFGEPSPATELKQLMEQIEDAGVDRRTLEKLDEGFGEKGIGKKYFGPVISSINDKVRHALGERLATPYLVRERASIRGSRGTVPLYGLGLRPEEIGFRG